MRIGVDLGGTKIEVLLLDAQGGEVQRRRIATPRSYDASVAAIADLVRGVERDAGVTATVGVGIPGTVSAETGLVKNANSTWLIGHPLDADLSTALGREVRVANDANCFALSEAVDGAAAGAEVVFGVIIGTGCGGGVVVRGEQVGPQPDRRGVGPQPAPVALRQRAPRARVLLREARLHGDLGVGPGPGRGPSAGHR